MKIGLISDTHIPQIGPEPPHQVTWAFAGVDLVLHAGDIYAPSCLDWLERIAPVRAVELGAAVRFDQDPRVAEKQVIQVGRHTIGLVHDLTLRGVVGGVEPETVSRLFPPGYSLPEALEHFFEASVDIVVFGHTHAALVEEYQGILLVNPGSPSLTAHKRELGTVAILELTPWGREAQIVNLAALR